MNSIYCETYGGYKIDKGQLSSTAYIKQDSISQIFTDPSLAVKNISDNFFDIAEINFDNIFRHGSARFFDNIFRYKTTTFFAKILRHSTKFLRFFVEICRNLSKNAVYYSIFR